MNKILRWFSTPETYLILFVGKGAVTLGPLTEEELPLRSLRALRDGFTVRWERADG